MDIANYGMNHGANRSALNQKLKHEGIGFYPNLARILYGGNVGEIPVDGDGNQRHGHA